MGQKRPAVVMEPGSVPSAGFQRIQQKQRCSRNRAGNRGFRCWKDSAFFLPDKRQKGDSGRNAFPSGVGEREESLLLPVFQRPDDIVFRAGKKSAIDDRVESC